MTVPARRLTVLGRIGIERDGVPGATGLPGRRAELVFAYLAVEHHRTVSRDELADALWPDLLPDSWAPALRGVITDVRRFLVEGGLDAGDVLERAQGGYRLRLPPAAVVDLDEARAALATAHTRLHEGDPRGAARSAERAAELARLPFLPHHEGEWVDRVRRELELLSGDALHALVHAHRRAGDLHAAAGAAERLVRAQPLDEAAHRMRIAVLAEGGDRSGAVQAFEQCRAVLRDELGVAPSAATEAELQRATRTPSAAPPQPQPQPQPQPPLAAYSVMVVEDHDFQRRTALALLRRLGVRNLSEARDGSEALDLLATAPPPDVIVCDIDMPGMDGVEFVRCVAERGLACAVVVASALERSVRQAVEAVCEGYGLQVLGVLAKPLTARRLAELLDGYRPRSTGDGTSTREATPADLAGALDRGELEVVFRPIADLAEARICDAEVVPRWRRPGEGAADAVRLPPAGVAAALTRRFTEWMVAATCAEQALLDRAGVVLSLWIPLPDGELADPALADRLSALVRLGGTDPHRIVCLIGPRALRRNAPDRLAVLTRLRLKGFGLCFDEFDVDQAEVVQLGRAPLTAVRLHPALLRDVVGDPARIPVVDKALEHLRELDLPAVVTGCDTVQAFELLLQLGCGLAQGELIAGVLPGQQLPDRAGRWRPPPDPATGLA